jgi:hypothetical protein
VERERTPVSPLGLPELKIMVCPFCAYYCSTDNDDDLLSSIIKLFAWGEGESGGHVLRETTNRDLCGLVCPSRTSKRVGEGDCVKEGGGEAGKRERKCALGRPLCHSPRH